MAAFWLAIFSVSLSWVAAAPFFGAASRILAGVFLTSGVGVLGLWIGGNRPQDPDRASGIERGPWSPRTLGGTLLRLIGLLLVLLPLQAAVYHAYPILHARCWRIDVMSWVTKPLLDLIGIPSGVGSGTLFVKSPEYLLEFIPEFGKLGLFAWSEIMVGATVGLLFLGPKRPFRSLVWLWGAGLLYLVLRYTALAALYASFDEVLKKPMLWIFWEPLPVAASFVPILLLIVAGPVRSVADCSLQGLREPRIARGSGMAAVGCGLGVVAFATFWAYQDPGKLKEGRILLDDSYSGEWEQCSRRFDKEWYGDLSVYNYSSLAQWLRHYYAVDINLKEPLTRKILGRYDILVIKTPTKRFSLQEVLDIQQFVADGGGLMILSDHTNLMGMSTFSNELLEPVGIRMRYDGVNALSGGFSLYQRPALGYHSAVGKLDYFEYLTSCSIDSPLTADDVMLVNNNLSDRFDYASGSFFGQFTRGPQIDFGPLVLAAAAPFQKGRVLAFSDSTTFNTFTLFMHGHSEFFKGAMEYLNRTNSAFARSRPALLVLAGLLTAAGLAGGIATRSWGWLPLSCAMGTAGWFAANLACGGLCRMAFPPRLEQEEIVRVNVLASKGRFGLPPAVGSTEIPAEYAMDTFYVTIQRIGFVPGLKASIRELLSDADIAVILNPAEHFDSSETSLLVEWVRRGGRLMILDNAADLHRSSLNELLTPLAIPLHAEQGGIHFHNVSRLRLPDPELAAFERDYGKGKVVLVLDSSRFSRKSMGHSFEKPGREEMRIYRSEFALLETALGEGLRR